VNVLPESLIEVAAAGDVELLLQLIMSELAAMIVKNKKDAVRDLFIYYEKIKLSTRNEINEVL
jgi:hypothetical protein